MHIKPIAACLIAVGCLSTTMKGQNNFWESSQAYLGQTRPSDTQIFAPSLLADPGTVVMDRIAFSQDDREIYYYQADGWDTSATAKIKYFRYNGHQWIGPRVLNEHLSIYLM